MFFLRKVIRKFGGTKFVSRPQGRCQVFAHAYETKMAVVYQQRPNMTVVGGNNYKQCNFENIPAFRRNHKETSSDYTQ